MEERVKDLVMVSGERAMHFHACASINQDQRHMSIESSLCPVCLSFCLQKPLTLAVTFEL